MPCSPAKLAANRRNAQRSSGPRTAEGKERSRANAFKHGMTGRGLALPREELDEVERRVAGFEASYGPRTEPGIALVRRAAFLSVRLERCAMQEAAAISANVRAAAEDFDEAREEEVDRLFELLDENPAVALRKLLRRPEGVERMLQTWSDLREDLTTGDGSRWTDEHATLAIHLGGRRVGGIGVGRVEALALAIGGDFTLLGPDDAAGLDAWGRRDWARRALASLIDSTSEELEDHLATLDRGAIAADRDGAASRALFDPSKAATLARKYEAAADREMHRALKEMRAIEAEAADQAEASSSPPSEVGSSSPTSPARPSWPIPTPPGGRSDDPALPIYVPTVFETDEFGRF